MTSQYVAVIMACYNRCPTTVQCLSALKAQLFSEGTSWSLFLLDDGSTDGTSDAVRQICPNATIIAGNGTLFWNGGMRVAYGEAMKFGFDFYLWLNDDTILRPEALAALIGTFNAVKESNTNSIEPIVVGTSADPDSNVASYGGLVRANRWHPMKFRRLEAQPYIQVCETFDGSCILIPHSATLKLGNLDARFTHKMGDTDYGLRARKAHIPICVAPGIVAMCKSNSLFSFSGMSLRARLHLILGIKGLPPREWFVLTSRHAGPLWPLFWLLPYARLLICAVATSLASVFRKRAARERSPS